MSFTWSFKAFAHDPNNPPSMQSICSVNLSLVNTIGVFQLFKEADDQQTEYKIVVQDPKSLGTLSDEQATINRSSQDLVLACNIVLQQVALSVFRLEPTKPDIMIIPSPAKVVSRDTPTGKSIEISGTIRARAEVFVKTIAQEDLDESRTVQLSNRLSKIQRFALDKSSTVQRANLINALHEYEAAMASLDRLTIFKHLYNVLELATNIDDTDRDGPDLDKRMAAVIVTPQNKCEHWRDLYNRTKHIHRDSADVETFVSGTERLTEYVPVMRQASGKTLANLLMYV